MRLSFATAPLSIGCAVAREQCAAITTPAARLTAMITAFLTGLPSMNWATTFSSRRGAVFRALPDQLGRHRSPADLDGRRRQRQLVSHNGKGSYLLGAHEIRKRCAVNVMRHHSRLVVNRVAPEVGVVPLECRPNLTISLGQPVRGSE